MRKFNTLSEQDVLALAISNEEEDGRTYADFAQGLRETYPDSARMFEDMAAEEGEHRRALIDLYVSRFGSHIPQMRRQHISGAPSYQPAWQIIPRGIDSIRRQAHQMEGDASRFYLQVAALVTDAGTRKLLGDLAEAELGHQDRAAKVEAERLPSDARSREDAGARKRFVLQIVQPGLVGLMDGSVSTLAPVFAAAFATHSPWTPFSSDLLPRSVRAFRWVSRRRLPMTANCPAAARPSPRPGLRFDDHRGGHRAHMPYLINAFWTVTAIAGVVVVLELAAIAYIQYRYMETPIFSAVAKACSAVPWC